MKRLGLIIGMTLAGGIAAAPAQAYTPDRTIEFMVHSGPGAGNDVFARSVQGVLEKLKLVPQTIQVLNKTGGGGLVAMSYLEEKKGEVGPLAVFTSVWWVNPEIRKEAKITMTELTPIARLILEPAVLTVNANSPYKTVKDFIEAAKKNPGKLKQSGGSLTSREATCAIQLADGLASSAADRRQGGVLLARVGPVLELDDAELGEAVAEPAVGRVEKAELLAVRDDLGEQERLEDGPVGCVELDVDHLADVDAEALPHFL